MTLCAENITVRVGTKTLVEDVSLTVEPGEVVAIIGPNGAGKSTLMRVLAGDTEPDAGQVRMGGRPLADWSLRDRARVRAVLAQSTELTFGFSVLEVALMGRAPHVRGVESPHDYAVARRALAAARVDHLEDRRFTTLSGGEQQRVQLARTLAQIWAEGTRYLLLDEPTNNLDLSHQHRTLDIARRFAADGTAVLTILHDLNLAAQYAHRIMVLKAGRSLMTGTPRAVLTPETIQTAFDVPVAILPHPQIDCPLVVPLHP